MYYTYIFQSLHNIYTYAHLLILFTIVLIVVYIKLHYPFWSSQPVYHTYDFIRWIYLTILWRPNNPYLIQSKVLKTRFVSLDRVVTIPYSDISSVQESELVDFLQCHSFLNENILNILDKTTIQGLLIGMSYVSFFQEDRLSPDLSDSKKEILGCISSRPLQCIVSGSKIPVYFWDHICVNREHEKIPRKNIAYKMIQTHEYRQRLMQPNVGASAFKKEGILCEGVVPLVKFRILTFELHKILKPPLPIDMTVVSVNADDVYDMIYSLTQNSIFTLYLFPEIGSLIELIRSQILRIYALKQKDRILGVYFLKDTQIVYDVNQNNDNNKVLECVASVDIENSPYFFAGFLGALHNVLEKKSKFHTLRLPDLGHNSKIMERWRWKYPPISEIPAAYYIYNMIVPQMPIQKNRSLILL